MSIHEVLTAASLGTSGRFCGSMWVSTHGTEAETPNISLPGGPLAGHREFSDDEQITHYARLLGVVEVRVICRLGTRLGT